MNSKPDFSAVVIGFTIFGLIVEVAILFAFIVAIPIAILAVGLFFLYRHYQFERIKAVSHLPETITDRPQYMTPAEFYDRLQDNRVLAAAEEDTNKYSCQPLSDAFSRICAELYAEESFHSPPPRPTTRDQITIGRYYDKLEQWQRKVSDESNFEMFTFITARAYLNLREYFPPYALQDEPNASTSLLTTQLTLSDEEDAAKGLVGIFFDTELKTRKLFQGLRSQLEENHEQNDEFSLATTFAQTPWRSLSRVQIPLRLADETRFAGMWVLAPQGMGKTTLLHAILREDLEKDATIILMDSKGDLLEPFLTDPIFSKRRVVIGPDNPIGMNPLEVPTTDINKAVDNLEYLFSSLLEFKLTPTQSMLLKAVFRTLVLAFPKPNLATFQEILTDDGPNKYAEQIKTLEPDLQRLFSPKEYGSENIRSRRQELLQRLRLLLDHDLLRSMLMATSTTFNIGEAMDTGKLVIINNSRARLGNSGAEFFGRFFIAQVLAAAQQRSLRSEKDKKPVYFFIDECYTVVARDERITDILHECRSQRIALCLAHQETTQVQDKVLNAFQNCAIRFVCPDEEAQKVAPSVRMDIKTLRSLKPKQQFVAYIRGLSNSGIVVNVQKPSLSNIKLVSHETVRPIETHKPPPEESGLHGAQNSSAEADPIIVPPSAPPTSKQSTSKTKRSDDDQDFASEY